VEPHVWLNVFVFAAAAVAMEGVAWALHKYVMHGFLWVLHEDHHRTHGRRFQKNDLFALFFAGLSFGLIYGGLSHGIEPMTAAGFGVTLYGIGYFTFHDFMFHGRIPALRFRPKGGYFAGIINAHRIHHSVITRRGAVSFGFLYAPRKYAEMKSR
jgi:beta-carotene 3-hydroxylase